MKILSCNAIERKTAGISAEERHAVRLEESLPIINDLGKWMHRERNMVLPKSLIGKAIEYCTKLWVSLMTYLEDGNFLHREQRHRKQNASLGTRSQKLPFCRST